MKGEEDLSEKRKFRREIEVEKNTVTKVSDVMTRIMGCQYVITTILSPDET